MLLLSPRSCIPKRRAFLTGAVFRCHKFSLIIKYEEMSAAGKRRIEEEGGTFQEQ